MSRTILDIHILQTVPPSNLNRDDTGTPKSALYGGVRRARVSSQAWKRATRKAFNDLLPPSELGVRTKKVAEVLAERITALALAMDPAHAVDLAAEMLRTATGSKIEVPKRKAKDDQAEAQEANGAAPESSYLMFLSTCQLDALAALAVELDTGDGLKSFQAALKKKENKAAAQQAVDTRHSVDIALFGRMVADSTDLNVEAATQVAHAISVHKSEIESDYYTAVDDKNKESEMGAGMIGSIDFNSATLYRYAAVDVDELHRTLGTGLRTDEAPSTPAQKAVGAFLEGFITSLPTGKINTFGNHTLPSAVIVKLRTRRPVSFVGAFEQPVSQGANGGFLEEACERLGSYVPQLEKAFGVPDGERSWVLRVGGETQALKDLGTSVTLAELVKDVEAAVARRLETGV
ncbi:type I-E CRISPR-associated protein Cas7/Cse4/CasC [Streptomyces sp. NPDC017056]|uniref:type I-E CRISPR-associated protein Cas7/Cse4/CasC n=1 Tax=Streptomyces sp. NPDC017056 TaxID=3364973 RepID=UPI0037A3B220